MVTLMESSVDLLLAGGVVVAGPAGGEASSSLGMPSARA